MLVVTLVGGIGLGKSTAAAMFIERGAWLLSLDDVTRNVLLPGEGAVREIGGPWSEAAREGKIDRTALARIVSDDAAVLTRLNVVVHPRTWEYAQAQLMSQREESLQVQSAWEFVAVVELALLAGSPYQGTYHRATVMNAPEDVHVLRLVGSRGMDEAGARARIISQTPVLRVQELADVVIGNGGSFEDAACAVHELWEGWLAPYVANMRKGRRVFGGGAPPSLGQHARATACLTRWGAFVNWELILRKGEAVPSQKGAEAALGGGGGKTAGDKGDDVLEIVGLADESSLANVGFVPCAGESRTVSQTYKSRRVLPNARRDALPSDSGDVVSGSGSCASERPRLYVSAGPRFAMAAVVTSKHD